MTTCKPRITSQASACAYNSATKTKVKCESVDQDGNYSLSLEPGMYKVLFSAWDNDKLAKKWFGDSYDSAIASTVTVATGSITNNINTILFADAGAVGGKITDTTSKPVEPFCVKSIEQNTIVKIYDKNNYLIDSAAADILGNYSILHIPPGEYKAVASPSNSLSFYYGRGNQFSNTWYNGQSDFNSASIIAINRNSNFTIDFTIDALIPHSITANCNGGGSISPLGTIAIMPGGSASYAISQDPGYRISDVIVDGISVGAVTGYSFNNVLEKHTILVVFQKDVIDSTKPAITAFSLPESSKSFTVPISLSATDNKSVTGYCITETNDSATCSWSPTVPQLHTFSGIGSKSIYSFAKDAAGNVSLPAIASTTISLPQLTVQLSGVGSGSVNRNPAGIPCSNSTCTALYDLNTPVSLLHTESAGSAFFGWTGACSGRSSCDILMNGDKNVTATFSIQTPVVKLGSQPPSYYLAISAAYSASAISESATIYSQEGDYGEELILDKPIDLNIKGGYERSFTSTSGYSRINSLSIAAGSLTIDRLIISSSSETPPAAQSTILMLDDSTPSLYSTLKLAIDAIPDDGTNIIKAGSRTIEGGVDINRNIQLTLLGGLDNTLTRQEGYLHIKGGLVISFGSLTIDGLILD